MNPRTLQAAWHGSPEDHAEDGAYPKAGLTWRLERTSITVGRIVRFWDPGYYRTYQEQPGEPTGHRGVQQEVTRSLARPQ